MIKHLARAVLGNVDAYILLQRIIGADRLRYHCIDALSPEAGDRLLDVGCGPAYYVERLPDVEYYGFDTNQTYIDHAREHYGDRGEFRCEIFSEKHADALPPMDGVLLMGLLHHLDDSDASELLRLVGRTLAEDGKVITLDTVFDVGQSRVRRFLAESDRGEHVRYGDEFSALARPVFADVRCELVTDVSRIPSDFYVMMLSRPRSGAT